MSVKNVKSVVKFSLSSLVDLKLTQEQVDLGNDYAIKASKQDESANALKDQLVATYSEEQQKILQNYGKEVHTASVNTELDLGHFIYDVFHQTYELPKAPLSQKIALKKMENYAKELSKEEFDVPPEVARVVKTALESEELWDVDNQSEGLKPLSFIVWFDAGDKRQYININVKGIGFYQEVVNAAVEAFADGDAPVERT